jgi:hypothetical protein
MVPSLHFELHSIEGRLQEMNGAVVGVDDELAIQPVRVFVSADQKLQGELFEDVIGMRTANPSLARIPASV